jgi:hypothetical protein
MNVSSFLGEQNRDHAGATGEPTGGMSIGETTETVD